MSRVTAQGPTVHRARLIASACVAFGLLLLVNPALAQIPDTLRPPGALKRLSLEQLMDVEVTSVSRRPEKLSTTASAIQIITGDDTHSVTVLVVDPDRGHQSHEQRPGADIALHVARHGAHARVEQVWSRALPIAEVILAHALDNGMDLIVIGAYSHARFVEMVFGGVTRTLLRQTPVPILLSR